VIYIVAGNVRAFDLLVHKLHLRNFNEIRRLLPGGQGLRGIRVTSKDRLIITCGWDNDPYWFGMCIEPAIDPSCKKEFISCCHLDTPDPVI
jgi:hypothetical protein